jgi:hypothetical protein
MSFLSFLSYCHVVIFVIFPLKKASEVEFASLPQKFEGSAAGVWFFGSLFGVPGDPCGMGYLRGH